MKPVAVHHVSLTVDDVDAALRFYVDTLGLSAREDRPDFGFPGAWLDVALECVHAAVVLTARELSALRDPELANWYLAAHGLSQA